jgi:hypothetical protein
MVNWLKRLKKNLPHPYGELAQKVEEKFAAPKSDMLRRVIRAQVGKGGTFFTFDS